MLTLNRPMSVAVLCSHRAPGLPYLLNRDRRRGRLYELACVVSSERTFAEEVRVERRGVPVISHPIAGFYAARQASSVRSLGMRAEYDAATVDLIKPFRPDLVLLDGYLYLVTPALLDAFPARVLNLHYGDLTLRLDDGRPRFPGLRAVRDAIAAGRIETRATVHLVNAAPDAGAPIVRSWPFPVSPMIRDARTWGAVDMLKAYAYAQQQWMIRAASGPLLAAALGLISSRQADLEMLAARDPSATLPWDLDERGVLVPPPAARRAPTAARRAVGA
jgi:folate-dependent phosphoribosylglycinamide formyltransferase PurN